MVSISSMRHRFLQVRRFQALDDREDYGEERIRAIGEHDGQVFVVTYTLRGDVVRLITAWKAGRNDREKYHAHISE